MQCNYCSRKFSCVNESRPGVTCAVLSPRQALEYMRKYARKVPNFSVVGIAGPGDPFANSEETMETLRLVKAEFPQLLLCVATNGLNLPPYVEELSRYWCFACDDHGQCRGPADWREDLSVDALGWQALISGMKTAEHLWQQQAASISHLARLGVTVKINTIYIPGVNDPHIGEVARSVAQLGADILNILPLYPVPQTTFADIEEPSRRMVAAARSTALSTCRR